MQLNYKIVSFSFFGVINVIPKDDPSYSNLVTLYYNIYG